MGAGGQHETLSRSPGEEQGRRGSEAGGRSEGG